MMFLLENPNPNMKMQTNVNKEPKIKTKMTPLKRKDLLSILILIPYYHTK